jgi:hypothetical protein
MLTVPRTKYPLLPKKLYVIYIWMNIVALTASNNLVQSWTLTDVGLANLLGTDCFRCGMFSGFGMAAPRAGGLLLLVDLAIL